MDNDDILSVLEAAKILGLTRQRVSTMCRTGVLDAKMVGNSYMISRASVENRRDNPPPAHRPPKNTE